METIIFLIASVIILAVSVGMSMFFFVRQVHKKEKEREKLVKRLVSALDVQDKVLDQYRIRVKNLEEKLT